ncbi:MAG: hypothetical protein KDA84_19995 [Planctomycetaceae bacterium]|nr:hypothetical protein [Planctomycetaceae bacterium]
MSSLTVIALSLLAADPAGEWPDGINIKTYVVNSLTYSQDRSLIARVLKDEKGHVKIRVLDGKSKAVIRTIPIPKGMVTSIAISPDNSTLSAALAFVEFESRFGTKYEKQWELHSWDLATGKTYDPYRFDVGYGLLYSCDITNSVLVYSEAGAPGRGFRGTLFFYDWNTCLKRKAISVSCHRNEMAISGNRQFIVSDKIDQEIVVRELRTGNIKYRVKHEIKSLDSPVLSEDGKWIAAVSDGEDDKQYTHLISTQTGAIKKTLPWRSEEHFHYPLQFVGGDRYLLILDWDSFYLWDTDSGRFVNSFPYDDSCEFTFDKNGFAIWNPKSGIFLWQLSDEFLPKPVHRAVPIMQP